MRPCRDAAGPIAACILASAILHLPRCTIHHSRFTIRRVFSPRAVAIALSRVGDFAAGTTLTTKDTKDTKDGGSYWLLVTGYWLLVTGDW